MDIFTFSAINEKNVYKMFKFVVLILYEDSTLVFTHESKFHITTKVEAWP